MQGAGLLTAYRLVDYIESSGAQHIDTGIVIGANDFTMSCNFAQTVRTTGEQPFVSIWKQSYGYWNMFIRTQPGPYYHVDVYTSAHHVSTNTVNLNKKYSVGLKRTGDAWALDFDSSKKEWNYTPSTVNDTSLKLFKRGDLNASTSTYIRMYSFELKIAGADALKLIPCVRKSDNKPGMYDTVSKTFYTNAGTGEFIVPED